MQIRAIGAHLPRLDQAGIAKFIADDVASFKITLYDLVKRGIAQRSHQEIEERALELPEELNSDLQRCALFELEVTENNQEFDPSEISNPESGYLGWEPAFITMDGEAILTEAYRVPATLHEFRVAFYVHEWDEPGLLVGPTGQIALPAFTSVPARLWRLAPYNCVD